MGGFSGLSDLPGLVFGLPRKGGPIGPLFLSSRFVGLSIRYAAFWRVFGARGGGYTRTAGNRRGGRFGAFTGHIGQLAAGGPVEPDRIHSINIINII